MNEQWSKLREIRATNPSAVRSALLSRGRRELLAGDGRLFIVAADHPARGALGVGENPMAMGDREELLGRLTVALDRPGVDGVLATADILEDLAFLGALENKVAVGSMNRGGLRGADFELDDRFTGYDVAGATQVGVDAVKLLLRIDLADHGSVRTLERSGHAASQAASAGLPLMIEPFMSRRVGGRVVNDLTTDAVISSVAISSGLGSSSASTWLKLPVVDDMERVLAATTLPTLLLGGDRQADRDQTFERWDRALRLPGVRGLVVGRTILYPADGDVTGAVDLAASMVHEANVSA